MCVRICQCSHCQKKNTCTDCEFSSSIIDVDCHKDGVQNCSHFIAPQENKSCKKILTPQEVADKLDFYARSAKLCGCIPSLTDGADILSFAASILHMYANGELKEVHHGKWVTHGGDEYHCSICNGETNGQGRSDYCENCGSIMDKKED